tara:strand:- start:3481 stop:3948 length:468 start_codon:yes stop_codon:yes gene_type:complete
MKFFFLFLPNILAMSISGRYDKARYNPKRNKYFWKHNMNVLPIEVDKAKLMSFSWKVSDIVCDYNYFEDYNEFDINLANKYNDFVKWTSENNKNVIKSLVALNVNSDEKKIYILKILPNPYNENFDIDLLSLDLDQLLLNEKYFDYELSFEKLNK